MACATAFVKYILFFFNILCFIGGLMLAIWGGLAYKNTETYIKVYSPDGDSVKSVNLAVAIIAFGCLVLFVSFLGCCGAFKENKFMLMSYSAILFLILAIEISVCVYSLQTGGASRIQEKIEKGFTKSFPRYHEDESIRKAWDLMQKNLKCCGKTNYTDWEELNPPTVPKSCCKSKDSCPKGGSGELVKVRQDSYYSQGCQATLMGYLSEKNLAIVAIIIGFVQLIGIIFACCLAGREREKSYNTY